MNVTRMRRYQERALRQAAAERVIAALGLAGDRIAPLLRQRAAHPLPRHQIDAWAAVFAWEHRSYWSSHLRGRAVKNVIGDLADWQP